MVTTNNINPLLFPDLSQQQIAIQRQQAFADALSQQSMQPIEPSANRGAYTTPITPIQGISKLGQAYASAMMQKNIDEKQGAIAKSQQQRFAQLMGAGSGNQQQSSPWVNPDTGQAVEMPPAQQSSSPFALQGVSPEKNMLLYSLDPKAYGEAIIKQNQPTDTIKNFTQAGFTPQEIATAIRAEATNKGTINGAPGNTLIMPNGDKLVVPDFKSGIAGGFDAEDRPYASAIPGVAQAAALQAGAIKGAEQANTIFTGQTVDGKQNVPITGAAIMNAYSPRASNQSTSGNASGAAISPPVFGESQVDAKISPAAAQAANEDFVKNSYRPVIANGDMARKNIGNLRVLDNLDISGKTGWGTETKAQAANILAGLGMGTKEANAYASDAQVFNSQLKNQVFNILGQQKGVQTEGDAARAEQTFANLGNTPEANNFVKDIAKATNNLQVKQSNFYLKNYPDAMKNGDLTRIEADWYNNAPSIWDDPVMKKWEKATPSPAPSVQNYNHGQKLNDLPDPATFPAGKAIMAPDGSKMRVVNGQWQKVQ